MPRKKTSTAKRSNASSPKKKAQKKVTETKGLLSKWYAYFEKKANCGVYRSHIGAHGFDFCYGARGEVF